MSVLEPPANNEGDEEIGSWNGLGECICVSAEIKESFRDRVDAGRRAWKKVPILLRCGTGTKLSSASESESGSRLDFHKIRSHLQRHSKRTTENKVISSSRVPTRNPLLVGCIINSLFFFLVRFLVTLTSPRGHRPTRRRR